MRNFISFVVAICAAVIFVSCSEEAEYSVFGGIYGVVSDAETNSPIQGASVVLSPTNVSSVTGADGSFVFNNLESQQYTMAVTASGYQYNSRQVTVQAGQNTSSDINLTPEEEVVGFSLSTEYLDFDTTYSELNFTISNTGNTSSTSWTITGIDESWLSVSPTSGVTSVGESSSLKVRVDRTLITSSKTTSFIVNAGGGSKFIQVSVGYAENTPELSVSATSLDFGESTNVNYFTISNKGTADLTFDFLGIEDWFTATCSSKSLSAGESTTVTVAIDRDQLTESKSHKLIVDSNASTHEVTINTTYTEKSADLSVSATTLDFGESSTSKSFTINNTGTADLEYEFMNIASWFTLSSESGVISAGGTKTILVSIDRDNISSSQLYDLILSTNIGSENIEISVTIPISTAELSVSATTLDFGESSSSKTFTIYNNGTASLSYAISGLPAWLSVSSSSGTVSAGSATIITLTADRSEIYGSVSSTISVTSNGGDKSITVSAYEPIDYGTVSNPNSMLSVEVTDVYMSGTTMYLEYKATYSGTQSTDYFNVMGPLNGNSSVSDNEGNSYDYNSVKLSLGGSSYSSASYGVYVYSTTANSVIKGGVEISNVDTAATKMNVSLYTNLRINSSNNYGSMTFTNVPIIR